MSYSLGLSAKAARILDRLDRKPEQRLLKRLDEVAANPLDARLSNKVEMAPGKRYSRVGDWRIVYEINEAQKTIIVITIQHRSRVYKEVKE